MASTRDRLLRAAAELFYREGINATGVDRVVERSGISKPTLYSHFRSKSALVTAVLQQRHEQRVTELGQRIAAAAPDPYDQLLAVFTWLEQLHIRIASDGCAFLNAAAEIMNPQDPARAVIREQKRWFRELLTDLVRRIGVQDPARVGAELMLLVDGASSKVLVDGDPTAAALAREAAITLIRADLLDTGREVRDVAARDANFRGHHGRGRRE
jgi:AcrR family transcriptional regulator